MQVLGMLPRKERKKKDTKVSEPPVPIQRDVVRDNRRSFEDRVKSRFNSGKLKNDILRTESGFGEDPDDPYAFPDPSGDAKSCTNGPLYTLPSPSPYSEAPLSVSSQGSHGSKSPGDGGSGVSSIAKLYPELAEKLEKIKPKQEACVKVKDKGKAKSSRTMNRLQTKIAQNRIKDKLKRNQESNSQSQSPCHGYGSHGSAHLNNSMVNHYDIDVMERTLPNNIESPSSYGSHSTVFPPGYNQAISETRKGYPFQMLHPNVMQSSPQADILPSPNAPEFGYPGLPPGIPHGVPLESLPGMPNSGIKTQQSVDSQPSSVPISYQQRYSNKSIAVTSSAPVTTLSSTSPYQLKPPISSASSGISMGVHGQVQPIAYKPPPPPYTKSVIGNRGSGCVDSLSSSVPSLSATHVNNTSSVPCLVTNMSSRVTNVTSQMAPHQVLPPPPPYRSKSRNTARTKTFKPLTVAAVPHLPPSAVTRPRKVKHILEDKDLPKKMKVESSKTFYRRYANTKQYNHSFVGAGKISSHILSNLFCT